MLAARPATEIAPCEQDRCPLVARQVQDEIRVRATLRRILPRLAVVQVPPLVEQVRPETAAPDRLQELLRNDLIGVDVGAIQRSNQAGVPREDPH